MFLILENDLVLIVYIIIIIINTFLQIGGLKD